MILKRLFYLFFLLAIGVGSYVLLFRQSVEVELKEANAAYRDGVESRTINERKLAFNRALTLYSELERKGNLALGNGRLYQNVGNIYYELESYPFALLYYYRALELNPGSFSIMEDIQRTRARLSLPVEDEASVFKNLFFFHFHLSLPKRLQLLFLFAVGALVLGSGAVWYRSRLSVWGAGALSFLTLLLTLSVLYTGYVEPLNGVLIEATLLTREAEVDSEWVVKEPIPAGTRVSVVDIDQKGRWLKVMTSDGTLGFTAAKRIRVI